MKNTEITAEKRQKILGIGVDFISKKDALEKLATKIASKNSSGLMQVITAYSEFFVIARKDRDFKEVFSRAELIVPDSVAPLAAKAYQAILCKGNTAGVKFIKGLAT